MIWIVIGMIHMHFSKVQLRKYSTGAYPIFQKYAFDFLLGPKHFEPSSVDWQHAGFNIRFARDAYGKSYTPFTRWWRVARGGGGVVRGGGGVAIFLNVSMDRVDFTSEPMIKYCCE